jgi:hypothetical protein
MDPYCRAAHSCEHCQRIVLRHEHFVKPRYKVRIPHSEADILLAIEEGCELFRHFFIDREISIAIDRDRGISAIILKRRDDLWPIQVSVKIGEGT